MIKLKRAYVAPDKNDGVRVLVERLWPRGVKKDAAQLTSWLKELAPSTDLRKWYNHQTECWPEFVKKYRAELTDKKDLLRELKKQSETVTLTFIYAAKDEARNSAVILKRFIEEL